MNNFERLECLIGKDNLQKAQLATVAVVGLGGVGGVCALTLARSGVGHLLIQDFDVVQETNILKHGPKEARVICVLSKARLSKRRL